MSPASAAGPSCAEHVRKKAPTLGDFVGAKTFPGGKVKRKGPRRIISSTADEAECIRGATRRFPGRVARIHP